MSGHWRDWGCVAGSLPLWRLDESHVVCHANFVPRDETLMVTDARSGDGIPVLVEVRVTDRFGYTVNTEWFAADRSRTSDLGTPDGSGDVPEGMHVLFRLCWLYDCTSEVDGVD
ncbi:hypothetical protein [Actinotalea caeni]|uniref:hypothetical protein n=1 Tax=Actinotalea caeni TaxID=1348467 RepID=UPI0012E166D5|nr:hypothetical protein [Actinotalea caeni]